MMTFTVTDSGTLAVLILRGDLKNDQADELQSCLLRTLGTVNRLIINCAELTGVEASCLRILCATYRMSQSLRKGFVLVGHQPKLFLRNLQATEYVQCTGCGLENDQGCMWGVC